MDTKNKGLQKAEPQLPESESGELEFFKSIYELIQQARRSLAKRKIGCSLPSAYLVHILSTTSRVLMSISKVIQRNVITLKTVSESFINPV